MLATTIPGRRAGALPIAVVVLAWAKVAVAEVEIIGLPTTDGFDAGGHAGGIGAIATVAWFAALLRA